MKKKLLVALAVTALGASSAYATDYANLAPAGDGVTNSVHDMNVLGGLGIAKDAQGRVCAFCHTPHHAIDSTDANAGEYMPLWSHKLTEQTYQQYDSGTYDAKNGASGVDPLAGPSRLCMSCHDGAIAPDQHYGATTAGGNKLFPGNAFTGTEADPQIGIGANGALNNTHPIGFSLTEAIAADLAGSNATGKPAFKTGIATGAGNYLTAAGAQGTHSIKSQLYGPNGIMTCATCHDVHNKDNVKNENGDAEHPDSVKKNYLVFAQQAGSQLCLSCHNK